MGVDNLTENFCEGRKEFEDFFFKSLNILIGKNMGPSENKDLEGRCG